MTARTDAPEPSTPPGVLLVHNRYRQPGGEDRVFTAEAELLRARGHRVIRHEAHNDAVAEHAPVALAARTIWSRATYRELRALIRRERPDVVHVHNTLPLLSPAVYYAAGAEGVPVVQTLHNYRLLCPAGLLLREGRVCEECVGRTVPLPAVVHGCYRSSRAATGAVAAMLSAHRLLGTWRERVDVYVALTEFARRKFVEGGLPAGRIRVKPNFLAADPGMGPHRGGYALFVGRLSPEKGIHTLLDAWSRLDGTVPLKMAGDGPLASLAGQGVPGVEWLGRQPSERVLALMRDASFLVFPSHWYEGLPMTLVEAFATGLPVISSRLGSMEELVEDGRTGLHFTPGDPRSLAAQVARLVRHPREAAEMGGRARAAYEARYTAERNYALLLDLYREVGVGTATSHPSPV